MLRKLIEEGHLQGSRRACPAGTRLYEANGAVESFFLLLKGSVRLASPSLHEAVIVQQGHLIGLQDLLQERHSHSATLLQDAEVLQVNKSELQRALQTDSQLRLYILQQMSKPSNPALTAYE